MYKNNKYVVILDLNLGNLGSIINVLDFLGINYIISNNKNEIKNYNKLIIPGVGSFNKAMENIEKLGLTKIIEHFFYEKKIMAICLGLQLLASVSYENTKTKGLNLIKTNVTKFNSENNIKIPHVMWNEVYFDKNVNNKLSIMNLISNNKMYFNHSFKIDSINTSNLNKDFNIAKTAYYDQEFISAIVSKNFLGVQFHPELSNIKGIEIYRCFLNDFEE